MASIEKIHARQILDSRGNPTIEVDVRLSGGVFGRAAVPSGASVGSYEALELRDGGRDFMGHGVSNAVRNVNKIIAPKIIKMNPADQAAIDFAMIKLDGTKNKSRLGANAILGVSLAVANAAAGSAGLPLYKYLRELFELKSRRYIMPRPMINIINGGRHADNDLAIQEFMIIPKTNDILRAVKIGSEIFHHLGRMLTARGLNTGVGDEGGYAPNLTQTRDALDLIMLAIKSAGYSAGRDVGLGLDVAAGEFYQNKKYHLDGQVFNNKQMIKFYTDLAQNYPIISIEDPFAENDMAGWREITKKLGRRVQLVGDDLFATNPARLRRGINDKIANAILIKPNQIGTLTETLETIKIAQGAKYGVIISHRSGETDDTTIADLSVATNAGQIKTGSMSRMDRIGKYNRLIQIGEEI
ncbi:MAG: phosphopyruvate hydratase [Rickettsiales bacterium]|jgi:enolase|nr:phosphopyruvate hydratase [Rickettsiales bacterium]